MLPDTNEIMQKPGFWINRLHDGTSIILNQKEIMNYNKNNISKVDTLYSIENYNVELTKEKIKEFINEYKIPEKTMYDKKGNPLTADFFKSLQKNINIEVITNRKEIQYGITVKNTSLRSFPTSTGVYKEIGDVEFDRFQETGCQVAEPVVILHESSDKKWFFIQMYNYRGWAKADSIAIVRNKLELFEYLNSSSFIVITGDYVHTQFNPYEEGVSYIRLDMGNRVPLEDSPLETVGNQTVYGNYVVKLPIRNSDGELEIKHALISKLQDISLGYLPYTRENILKQIFKLSGCRYGWGDSLNGRDCSSTIMYVYKTFGFLLPRNGDEQATSLGISITLNENVKLDERKSVFEKMQPGAVIFMPGHVMMYIGTHRGNPYMIHCFYGYGELVDSVYKFRPVNEVAVTSTLLTTSSGALFINRFSSLLQIE